jgi:hypothetical protein
MAVGLLEAAKRYGHARRRHKAWFLLSRSFSGDADDVNEGGVQVIFVGVGVSEVDVGRILDDVGVNEAGVGVILVDVGISEVGVGVISDVVDVSEAGVGVFLVDVGVNAVGVGIILVDVGVNEAGVQVILYDAEVILVNVEVILVDGDVFLVDANASGRFFAPQASIIAKNRRVSRKGLELHSGFGGWHACRPVQKSATGSAPKSGAISKKLFGRAKSGIRPAIHPPVVLMKQRIQTNSKEIQAVS